jgi:hypothetical protein
MSKLILVVQAVSLMYAQAQMNSQGTPRLVFRELNWDKVRDILCHLLLKECPWIWASQCHQGSWTQPSTHTHTHTHTHTLVFALWKFPITLPWELLIFSTMCHPTLMRLGHGKQWIRHLCVSLSLSFSLIESRCVGQASLELVILLPPPLECWDNSHVPPPPAETVLC